MAILDAAGIAAILPHRGAMSLLDAVVAVDATRIECLSDSHRRAPHPMADADGRLGIACAIEYGAQAMAL
ncbi:MAG: 3-hydroxylacyl-ACP dehydratase, partial [Burkholderiaceae bacterium]